VKCPKCGFVSFPGHEQCKKCGHSFTQVNGQVEGIPPLFHRPDSEPAVPPELEPESALDQTELGEQETGELDVSLEPQGVPPSPIKPEEEKPAPRTSQPPGLSPWQAELAERVQEYRQRRARLHKDEENGVKPLNLDFGASAPKPEAPRPNVIEFPSADEPASHPKAKPAVQAAPPSFGMASFESAFREDKEEIINPPRQTKLDSHIETGPLEIELGPSGDSPGDIVGNDPSAVAIARMSMRFFAALIDAAVLLAGTAVYALVYWQVGGIFSPGPLEIVVAGVVGAFFVLLYFAGCTAIASATPGLIWAGLEVITFEGNPPKISHCLWRGLGYLVSMTALMLGFVWAAVDAEGLTWHDRMSRTFIVPADH
jgi:uncharacterized RDD family membrane protein YckC